MYVKNNFSNYFILATILLYILRFNFDHWSFTGTNYSSKTIGLQAIALGLYSLFYENGFLKANPYYKVFIIALITSYQTDVRISCVITGYCINTYYLSIVWAMLALVLYNKLPKVLTYIFRYEIGFSIISYTLRYIPYFFQYDNKTILAIISGLSVVFIFIPYLTFDRIVYYSSILLFSHMVSKALLLFIYFIPHVPYQILYDNLTFNITIGVVFATALGYQRMNNISQAILLEDDEPSDSANATED